MKIKITATCVIDSDDYPHQGPDFLAELNVFEGEGAFEELVQSGEDSNNEFVIKAEEVAP